MDFSGFSNSRTRHIKNQFFDVSKQNIQTLMQHKEFASIIRY